MRKIKTTIKNPELVEKRRNQILEAATELFRKEGYHATTMRKICKKAKFNQGSFYDYFESKEDILVYIYNQVMNRDLGYVSPDSKISSWEGIEDFLRTLMSSAWTRDKNNIQLLYRETKSLDKKTMREVLKIESDHIKWVAEKLREGLGLSSISMELEMVANLAVYINSFIPLRGWNLKHIDREEVLNFAVDMLMSKLEKLRPADGS
jgi:TetR/AcrR family transcriptional regulator, cholesterol catabolism regulator